MTISPLPTAGLKCRWRKTKTGLTSGRFHYSLAATEVTTLRVAVRRALGFFPPGSLDSSSIVWGAVPQYKINYSHFSSPIFPVSGVLCGYDGL
jgi:hypothetical protein